jgi:fumarylacetoacetase
MNVTDFRRYWQNFATTISPWIVPIDALEEFKRPGYDRDPPVLPYLEDPDNTNFAIPLEVRIRCELLG